ncbi:MAG TPA: hypothetical protein DCL44_02570 [Elusimicrobia bacterium]|nr:hypothetical protein [Elusimicrobiota bacterium]
MRIKTIIVSGALSALAITGGIRFSAPSHAEWGVLVLGLPHRISTNDAFQAVTYYVLKQTHEPVFRKDDGQKYHSKILRRWSRNPESSEYEFCPNTFLRFNDSADFSFPFFLAHIRRVTNAYDLSASIKTQGDCVQVKFPHSQKRYLDVLTYYENAPTIRRTDRIEDGLGQYSIVFMSSDTIALERKEHVSSGYNKVVFYEYKGKDDPNLQNRNIKDFNTIPMYDVPAWAVREYFSFNTVEMKSVNLIINHPDLGVRKAVYNCLNVADLRHALFPLKKDFYNIKTVLPIGMPGATGGVPSQQCDLYRHQATGIPLTFANWNKDIQASLIGYIDSVNKQTGMNIRVVNYDPRDLVAKIHETPHPYNMVVIVMDAIHPDYAAFLALFVAKKGYHDFTIKGLANKYNAIQNEDIPGKKVDLARSFAEELVNQAGVLTLYQNVKTYYYPKELKHFALGKGFLQYPEVSALQI